MKTILTNKITSHLFLLGVMFSVFGMLFPFQAYAQHEDLLDRTWYLYKIEVGGVDYEYSSIVIDAGDEARIKVVEENNLEVMIQVDGCPGRGCDYIIEFVENENKFIIIDRGCLAMEFCKTYRNTNEGYVEIENHFHNTIFNNHLGSIVEYEWQTIDNISFLIFTNSEGDKIYYTAENLSVSDFNELNFSISPNPTQNQLNIRLAELLSDLNLEIYDIQGKLIEHHTLSEIETQLDVSKLSSGIYFIKLTEDSGAFQTMRFVKE